MFRSILLAVSIASSAAVPVSGTLNSPQIAAPFPNSTAASKTMLASQSEFSELQRASRLSSAAYAGCDKAIDDVVITHQVNNNATDTQGYMGYSTSHRRLSLVLRGSNTWFDYLTDLSTSLVPLNNLSGCIVPADVKVASGVYKAWQSVHDEVIAEMRNLSKEFPDYGIEVMGHSLGGSLSYLGFLGLAMNFPQRNIAGMPLAAFPIGNPEFTSFASSFLTTPSSFTPLTPSRTLYRGTNNGDGVPNMYTQPNVPIIGGDLHHFGTEFYTNGTLATTLRCNGERDMNCSAGNGNYLPNLAHYSCFGVSMKVQGALTCAMSGGSIGAAGGSIARS